MSVWSAAEAREKLEEALPVWSLRGDIHLLHFAKNTVFSLPRENLAVKVSRPDASYDRVARSLRFAEWLEEEGVAGPRVAGEISRVPVRMDNVFLSFWRMDNFVASVSAPELAEALRTFHVVAGEFSEELPPLDPLGDIAEMLRSLQGSSWDNDLLVLWEWHERLQEKWMKVPSLLGEGAIHGNAHRGNVTHRGREVCMMDFDLIAWGPREWDLLPETLSPRRYGRPHRDYQLFARTYGFDVVSWPGFQDMVLVRELLATVFRMQADQGLRGQTESDRRLLYWKGQRSPAWRGF